MNRSLQNIFAGLQVVTPPQTEPIQPAEVRDYFNLPPGDSQIDRVVGQLIPTARKFVENTMARAFLTQAWQLSLINWPGRDYLNWPQAFTSEIDKYYRDNYIALPGTPLQLVTSISYITSAGETKSVTPVNPPTSTQTLGYVNVFKTFEPGRIVLPFSAIWPVDILMPGAPITITYTVGYTSMEKLTAWEGWHDSRQAIMMLIGDCYENRVPSSDVGATETAKVVEKWLMPFRVF